MSHHAIDIAIKEVRDNLKNLSREELEEKAIKWFEEFLTEKEIGAEYSRRYGCALEFLEDLGYYDFSHTCGGHKME